MSGDSRGRTRLETLASAAEFQRVLADGERLAGRFVLLFFRRAARSGVRVGVSASARIRTNVERNRVKRLLREAARHEVCRLTGAWDLVLIGRASAVGRSLDDVERDVRELLGRMQGSALGAGEEVRC
ncbi:MAG: ribonuclease P protein component [Alicyclobacillus sp.]|nr:ribonuclease P protein component [Alicyclobacillus sp.]